jgi:hypothetical protein
MTKSPTDKEPPTVVLPATTAFADTPAESCVEMDDPKTPDRVTERSELTITDSPTLADDPVANKDLTFRDSLVMTDDWAEMPRLKYASSDMEIVDPPTHEFATERLLAKLIPLSTDREPLIAPVEPSEQTPDKQELLPTERDEFRVPLDCTENSPETTPAPATKKFRPPDMSSLTETELRNNPSRATLSVADKLASPWTSRSFPTQVIELVLRRSPKEAKLATDKRSWSDAGPFAYSCFAKKTASLTENVESAVTTPEIEHEFWKTTHSSQTNSPRRRLKFITVRLEPTVVFE